MDQRFAEGIYQRLVVLVDNYYRFFSGFAARFPYKILELADNIRGLKFNTVLLRLRLQFRTQNRVKLVYPL